MRDLLVLNFKPEVGGGIFLRNIGRLVSSYRAVQPDHALENQGTLVGTNSFCPLQFLQQNIENL
jgi:hypothetical protein